MLRPDLSGPKKAESFSKDFIFGFDFQSIRQKEKN